MFLVTSMQTLFAAEEVFHSETAKASWKIINSGSGNPNFVVIDLENQSQSLFAHLLGL